MDAVETVDVTRVFGSGDTAVWALRGITLRVAAGEWVGLRGRSGSGKTTLLNCIGGLDRPTAGSVSCFGTALSSLSDGELTRWRREQVGFVFQSFALIPTLSAQENVELPMRIAGAGQRRERTRHLLDLVGLNRWGDHRPHEMSGGQQQRVAIARALANSPRLILADEPTGELDTSTGRDILRLLGKVVREEGITLLMSSHDPLALAHAGRVLEIRDGRIADAVTAA